MKKRFAKFCAAALAAALLLTGCGGGPVSTPSENTNKAMGRFVEKELKMPGDVELVDPVLCQGKDGALIVFEKADTLRRWDSADGGDTWVETPIPSELAALDAPKEVAYGPDGSIWVSYRDGRIFWVNAEGVMTQLKIEELEQAAAQGMHTTISMTPTGTGQVYIDYSLFIIENGAASMEGSGMGLYQTDGRLITELSNIYGAAVDGDFLYLSDYQNNGQKLEAATGKTLEANKLAEETTYFKAQNGQLYDFTTAGMRKQSFEGSLTQIILESAGFTFGDPTANLYGFEVLSDEQIVMLLQGASGMKLYRYDFDKTLHAQAATSLRVWALEDQELLRLAIGQYRRANPDVDVTLEVALQEGTSQTTEDAVRTLNTELLSGQGPDVIVLDGLPAESFIKSGMLADLSSYVDASTLQTPFIEPFKTDKGIFMLPAQFKMQVLAGTPEDMAKANSLAELCELVKAGPALWDDPEGSVQFQQMPLEQRPTLYMGQLQSAFDTLWNASAPAIVPQNGQVDEAAYRQLLQALATLDQKYELMAKGQDRPGGTMGSTIGTVNIFFDGEMFCYGAGSARMGSVLADNIYLLAYARQGSPESEGEVSLFPGLAQGAYLPKALVGVSSASAQQQAAGAFVKYLFSEEVQSAMLSSAMPTTKAGMAAQLAQEQAIVEGWEGGERESKFSSYDPAGLINQLTTPILTPIAVKEAAYQAAEAFCKGEVDESGAVAQFAQAVNLYLAEQK